MPDNAGLRVIDRLARLGLPLLSFGLAAMTAHAAIGDEILLHGGGKLEGRIVEATDNIVVIHRPSGGVQQIARRRVAGITVALEDGSAVSGELAGWQQGTHQILTTDGIVRIQAGQIVGGDSRGGEEEGAQPGETEVGNAAPPRLATHQQSYVPPPIYILRNGATFVGRPIGFQDPLLTVRRATGGQQTLRAGDVKEVVVRDSEGGSLAGEFIDWSDGVFELRVDDRLIRVAHGTIIGEATQNLEIGGPLEDLPEAADPSGDDEPTLAAVEPDGEDRGSDPTSAGEDGGKIIISASAEPANEHDDAVIFTLQLSRPAPQTLAVIYSVLEDTAERADFEKGSGVVTIKAGADVATIRIPLVDDDVRESRESFRLFLSSDPKLVELTSNRVAAVIEDND